MQFFFELNGYLVLRGAMDPAHLDEAIGALDDLEDRGVITSEDGRRFRMPAGSMMSMPPPHSLPFRAMLAHPKIVRRLSWILGGGFRCNRAGNLIDWRGDWREEGLGHTGHRLHAAGHPVLPEFNYHGYVFQNGRQYAGSCNVYVPYPF
jgi:hypothetical protein